MRPVWWPPSFLIVLAVALAPVVGAAVETRGRAQGGEEWDATSSGSVSVAPTLPPSVDLAPIAGGADRGIPWDRLEASAYQAVRDVVGGSPVFREVRHIAFRSRKVIFDFLLDHPDFAAEVARAVREGTYRVRRVGDVFEVEDGVSARGTIRPLFAEGDRRAFYIEGRYESPVLPTLAGRLVLLLEAPHVEGPDGITYCELGVAGYVSLDPGVTEILGQVSRGLSEARVDRRVRRFFRHVAAVSRRAYDDPEGLADLLARRPGFPPERLAEFQRLLLAHLPPGWSESQRFQLLESVRLEVDEE